MKYLAKILAAPMVILIIIFSFASCGQEENVSALSPTTEFFVNDFAGVISDEGKTEIISRGAALQKSTSAQIVALTIDSTNDREISEYALETGRSWGIGSEAEDNGILLLLAVEDREVYIAVGYGLEGALPDSKIGRILDRYGVPYFSEDKFSEGLVSVYRALVNEVYIEYGLEPESGYLPIDMLPETEGGTDAGSVAVSWMILIIIIALYITVFSRRRGFISVGPFFGGFGGGFRGGSGGFSGGGFRGGGGSFGGGGAGRGF